MRRRLYFLLPDVESAKRTADDLLLARIEDRHMRFLARRGTDLGELHEASYLQKTDLAHGAGLGLAFGGLAGLVLGAIIVVYPPEGTQPQLVAMLIAAIVGAVLGAWMASMAAAAVPNSRLQQFQQDIERGKVLLMVDVPYGRVEQTRALVLARHPEALPRGQESRFPAFP
jgi:membrane protein implicated in regulation of membrane protease activity